MGMTWKESEAEKRKNKKVQKETIKSFSIRNYNFYPCAFRKSLSEGFLYYLAIKNHKGINQIEQNSPKFKTKKEAIEFAESGKVNSFVLG
jgi:hypothetical protein